MESKESMACNMEPTINTKFYNGLKYFLKQNKTNTFNILTRENFKQSNYNHQRLNSKQFKVIGRMEL